MPCILIVDNESYQRLLVQEILSEDATLTFVQAVDGPQALEMARVHKVDVVILSVRLPKTDGFQVCHQFRTDPSLAQTPIILLGTVRRDQDALLAQTYKVIALIYKPFEDRELQTAVQDAIVRSGKPPLTA